MTSRIRYTFLSYFGIETPTHICTTHAISKFQQKLPNRIPRKLDKNFYIQSIIQQKKSAYFTQILTEISMIQHIHNLFQEYSTLDSPDLSPGRTQLDSNRTNLTRSSGGKYESALSLVPVKKA